MLVPPSPYARGTWKEVISIYGLGLHFDGNDRADIAEDDEADNKSIRRMLGPNGSVGLRALGSTEVVETVSRTLKTN